MIDRAYPKRRFRTILDCSLVLLLILAAIPGERRSQARAGAQPLPREGYALESTNPSANQEPARNAPSEELAPQDDNLLAAMIAAENAALTMLNTVIDVPLYLPMINR
jgi:hypothetical protein